MSEIHDFVTWSQDRDVIGCACLPDDITPDTGFMLVVHGHGNNRFQYRDMMLDFAERYNVICISPEYRDSGRDSGLGERGSRQPYDWSHLQLVDTMNCLRHIKLAYGECDQSRTFAWGGSQGAHIVMLASCFAPSTFALTIECCGPADRTNKTITQHDVDLELHEAEIRSPLMWMVRLDNKLYVFHGTADETVDVEHARLLIAELRSLGKDFEAYLTEGGDHFLRPVTTRDAQTIEHCSDDIMTLKLSGPDDFELETVTKLPCTGATYVAAFTGGSMTLTREEVT